MLAHSISAHQVEKSNTVKEPLSSDLINGVWTLRWTTSASIRASPLVLPSPVPRSQRDRYSTRSRVCALSSEPSSPNIAPNKNEGIGHVQVSDGGGTWVHDGIEGAHGLMTGEAGREQCEGRNHHRQAVGGGQNASSSPTPGNTVQAVEFTGPPAAFAAPNVRLQSPNVRRRSRHEQAKVPPPGSQAADHADDRRRQPQGQERRALQTSLDQIQQCCRG